MNNNPELGTYWSGRLLISARFVDTIDPLLAIKPMSNSDVQMNKTNDLIDYGIIVDAFYGLQLP